MSHKSQKYFIQNESRLVKEWLDSESFQEVLGERFKTFVIRAKKEKERKQNKKH